MSNNARTDLPAWPTTMAQATQQHIPQPHNHNTETQNTHLTTQYTETTIHSDPLHNNNNDDNEEWGDHQKQPPTQYTLRIGFQNIGPQRKSFWCHHARSTSQHIKTGKYDAFLFADFGLHFGKLPPEHHWRERMRPIFRTSVTKVAYNTNDSNILSSPFQAGGSGITLGDELAPRMTESGADPTGLGRWAWFQMTGKNGFSTILAAAYRPTNNRRDNGSVWNQHRRYFLAHGDDREPIAAFDQDLCEVLSTWLQTGANIILGMDANEDVRRGPLSQRLSVLGLQEAITRHHHPCSPPATQNRNRSRIPIDGIWVTGNVEVTRAGYTAFGGGCPSDHRGLWIDITTASSLGHRPPRLLQPVAQRLHSGDPRITRKYCQLVTKQYESENIFGKVIALEELILRYKMFNSSDQQPIIDLYQEIHSSSRAIRRETARTIRKVKRGEIPWSP